MEGTVAAPRRAQGTAPLGPGQGLLWAIDGYTLMFAALPLFAGSLSDGSSGAGLVPSRSVLAARSACPERGLVGDHDAMEVLISRVLLRPTDPERSRAFYRDTLGLAIYREFGDGPERGTVFFLGGGFLELSGRAAEPPAPGMALWLQVRDLAAVRQELGERGIGILREPRREPWGLLEMWIADPDGLRICIVEVPADHPLRRRD
jgi:catechol 2,3-dioxygenase-like lactoylglutathione lyase family enzyme